MQIGSSEIEIDHDDAAAELSEPQTKGSGDLRLSDAALSARHGDNFAVSSLGDYHSYQKDRRNSTCCKGLIPIEK